MRTLGTLSRSLPDVCAAELLGIKGSDRSDHRLVYEILRHDATLLAYASPMTGVQLTRVSIDKGLSEELMLHETKAKASHPTHI